MHMVSKDRFANDRQNVLEDLHFAGLDRPGYALQMRWADQSSRLSSTSSS